jgi:DNA-binding XRE family transcriptional regulator
VAETFAQCLKGYMDKTGGGQKGLAGTLGVDRTTISKWLTGKSKPRNCRAILGKLSVPLEQIEAMLDGVDPARSQGSKAADTIAGNYELFQWSYCDDMILKTNIVVRKQGKEFEFEEEVKTTRQDGHIKGRVSIFAPNMFFHGKSDDVYKEYEVIVVRAPRIKNCWLTGVVAGVSSDDSYRPSASRVVLHYLSDQPFGGLPVCKSLTEVELPADLKRFLNERPEKGWPILFANSHEATRAIRRRR